MAYITLLDKNTGKKTPVYIAMFKFLWFHALVSWRLNDSNEMHSLKTFNF